MIIKNAYLHIIGNCLHTSTKYTPTFLIYNNNNEITELFHENYKNKFKNLNIILQNRFKSSFKS